MTRTHGDEVGTWGLDMVLTVSQPQLPCSVTEKAEEIASQFLLMESSGFLLLFSSEVKEQRKEKARRK